MVKFNAIIQKFAKQGEKTGWVYISIPANIANKIKPNTKTSYRVKGLLDDASIAALPLMPMGEGDFIMALNATTRKLINKRVGDEIIVQLEEDKVGYILNSDFLDCLQDEPNANEFFNTLTKGHQNYFSKWIDSAKTEQTKAKRIAMAVNALAKKWDYGTMIRTETTANKLLKGK